ncbi:hypothetical protein C7999DRAFT_32009 [Corynascus novoguineensis]|uniref:Uncharacterized protein n=1 Tax=Corynascus novoguineensis TaxID=1126955 RepID=A0AAN7HFD5_9PEZI|nr:hypothetical protein C7999DRAFT_32009 [Corynascus novoguineensis]
MPSLDDTDTQSERIVDSSAGSGQSEIDISAYQDIFERNIKPSKLVALLRKRFGAGSYEIHMIHEIYIVRAPERLSELDIELCK